MAWRWPLASAPQRSAGRRWPGPTVPRIRRRTPSTAAPKPPHRRPGCARPRPARRFGAHTTKVDTSRRHRHARFAHLRAASPGRADRLVAGPGASGLRPPGNGRRPWRHRTASPTAPQAVVQAASATTTALVMGPSGVPDPSSTYVTNVNNLYIQPNSPGAVTQVVFTPEGLYPITGVKSLPLNTSVTQGLEMLSQTAGPLLAGGTPVTIFGYSQSAIISSLYQEAEAQLLPTAAESVVRPGRQRDEPQRRVPVPLPGPQAAQPGSGLLRRDTRKRLPHNELHARIRRLRRLPALPAQLPGGPQRGPGHRLRPHQVRPAHSSAGGRRPSPCRRPTRRRSTTSSPPRICRCWSRCA